MSSDAQIAGRIEDFCSIYESTILLTSDLYKVLSEKGKNSLRLIDNVVMNESLGNPKVIQLKDFMTNRKSSHLI